MNETRTDTDLEFLDWAAKADEPDAFDKHVARLHRFDTRHPLPDPPPAPPPFAPVRPSKLIGYLESEAAGRHPIAPAGFHRRSHPRSRPC